MSRLLTVPATWAITQLGKVTEYGKTLKAEPGEIELSAWVLELEDIQKNTSKLLARVSFADRQSKSTKNRFETGDVLYGKLRPYLNKIIIADNPGYCTTEIIPLKAGDHLDIGECRLPAGKIASHLWLAIAPAPPRDCLRPPWPSASPRF